METAVCLVENRKPLTVDAARAIRGSLGMTQVRLAIDDAIWNPEERSYDLQGQTATDIYTLYSVGLKIHANLSWCAPWKAGGSIWMRPYTGGCGRYVDQHDPVDPAKYGGGWEFADDREYCINPTHISAKWMRRSGEMFAQWFGRSQQLIYAISCGNEPDGEIYNAVLHAHTQDEAFARYATEYSYPFLLGAVSAAKPPLIVTSEAAGSDGLRRMLEWANRLDVPIDVISAHGYADNDYPGYPIGALERWATEFAPVIDAYGRTTERPLKVWNTECGANAGEQPVSAKDAETYLRSMAELGVDVVTHNNVGDLFVDWAGGNFALTDVGEAFREFNERTRRRAVTA